MPDILYDFDPDGDVTFIIEFAPKFLPHNLSDLDCSLLSKPYTRDKSSSLVQPAKSADSPSLHIRASSKHLMLASAQFKRTFQNGFQEGNELRSVGHVKIPICGWEPVPFLLLMAIFHGQTHLVPKSPHFKWLTEMAILVDYYECYRAIAILSGLWTRDFEKKQLTLAEETPMEWLCITWVFRRNYAFSLVTGRIQLESEGKIMTNHLPIPAGIIDKMQKAKDIYIGKAFDSLHKLLDHLRYDPPVCSNECNLMRLGILDRGMHKLGILSAKPELPITECSFMGLRTECQNMTNSYTFHRCELIPEVLKELNNAYARLDRGLALGSFCHLR
ncbi:hypothetical protein BDV39DRAFT_201310 [Aspergillus sergii]|uniref:BTB domain-containing protein n=1 Tax=Aspergillus sergii TaxID=1034303 RepID=A0A5N6XEB0_9EURO|nr:hypothetical protein BDV39DRAFT_201310 [Aspergillus sergii]